MKLIKLLIITIIVFSSSFSYAVLEISVVKKDEKPIKIAINKFKLFDEDIASIIKDNLNRSGNFYAIITDKFTAKSDANYLKNNNIEAILSGSIEKESENIYQLFISLYDVYNKEALFNKSIKLHTSGFRKAAHQLSDDIYESLLGTKGFFNTLLTYILIKNNEFPLEYFQLF
jgi:TolB protein